MSSASALAPLARLPRPLRGLTRPLIPRAGDFRWRWLLLSAVLPGVVPLPAAADEPAAMVLREPSAEVEPVAYDAALLRSVPAELLQDHAVCYLLNRDVHELDAEGRIHVTHHTLARINSREGMEAAGDWPLWFDPGSESIVLHVARVHKPDGRIVDVPPEDLHFRDENTDFRVFDVSKYLIVSFSQLAVGDVIEFKYTRRQAAPQYGGQLYARAEFSDARFPIHRSELVVRVPREKPLVWQAQHVCTQPAVTTEDQTRTYRWQLLNQPPVPDDENRNRDEIGAPGLAFSTFQNWEEVAQQERLLRRGRDEATSELRELVAGLVKDRKTPRDKAQALVQWVRRNVRYLSIGHNSAGYTPHSPAQVLAKRYGNCLDQSHLLFVMCREAGLAASHVFLNTSAERQLLPEVPSLEAEHAILLLEIDGEMLWIDPTATTTAWDGIRGDLFGRQAYVVDDTRVRLLKLPELTADRNRIDQESTIELNAKGDAVWTVRRTYYHKAAEDIRGQLLEVPPGRARAKLLDDFGRYYPARKALPPRIERAHLEDPDMPLTVSWQMSVPELAPRDEDQGTAVADLYWPLLAAQLANVEFDSDDVRMLPFEPFELRDKIVLKLPKGARMEPVDIPTLPNSKWGRAILRVKPSRDGHTVEIERRVVLQGPPPAQGERDDFAVFLAELEQLVAVSLPIVLER